MQLVTLEISDDYYDKFLHVVDALPTRKNDSFKSDTLKDDLCVKRIDTRIDRYLKDKSYSLLILSQV